MERKSGNEVKQYKGKWQLLKRCLTFMLATVVTITSIPLNMAWADELPYYEQPGDDEIILDDSVEEGDLSDIDLDISHTISKKGDKAVVTVSADPSESGLENGVTKVTKVEIHENGKLKKGKRSDGNWEFTVKENGVYSFVIYYSSNDGEELITATPSEIEKVEPTTEAEPQKPGQNTGGAGGGVETTQPEENPDITPPETEEGKTDTPTEGENTEDDKKNDDTVEGDSNQDTPVQPDQNPSDNPDPDKTEDDKTTGNEGGADSSDQAGNSGSNTDNGSGDHSNSADNTGDVGSGDQGGSSSGDNNSSGSADNGSSDSSNNSDSGSSNGGDSGSSDSSGSGSSDSGSSDNSGSDEGSDSSIALNVIDFFFPVIEAQASDFTVKKAVIVEYEITNLFPEGSPDDVDVDIFEELTEEGAMITLLVEPSDIGLEKGVREITDITLVDFEPEENPETAETDEIGVATDSEAEEEIIEEEEAVEKATPSEASYNTAKTSNAKHAEYQTSENDEGEYRFFVKENGTYTFSIRYGRAEDLEFEDSTELVETQFSTTYELDSIARGVQFTGVEDITIQAGEAFDLMTGVSAISDMGMELPVVIQDKGGFDPMVPGIYQITYSIATRSIIDGGNAGRSITVMPRAAGDLSIVSDVHGEESGKTLTVPINTAVSGMLSLSYDLPVGVKDRVLKIAWPEGTSSTYPTDNISGTYWETIDGIAYKCLKINDTATGNLTFDMKYTIEYRLYRAKQEEYLIADGKIEIGQIHVVATTGTASSDEAPIAESSIGPFFTKKIDEEAKPYFIIAGSAEMPYNHDVEMDMRGQPIKGDYILGYDPKGSSTVSLALNDYKRKPRVIKKIRVYAPTQFSFEIDSYDADHGVVVGIDGDGVAYMEFPYSVYEQNGTDSINSLFNRTKVITQDELVVPIVGLHTSKNTILYCVDYGGGIQEMEIESVLTLDVTKVTLQEKDLLKVENYGTSTIYAPWESSNESVYIVRNSSKLIKKEEGIAYWAVPVNRKNITISVSYPQELQARAFSWYGNDVTYSYNGASIIFDKIVMHLASGETVELAPGQRNDSSVNPADSHVDSVDYIFKELYGRDVVICTEVEVGNIHEAADVYSGGTIKGEDESVEHVYRIKPRKALRTKIYFSQMDGQLLTDPNKAYGGYLTIAAETTSENRVTTNPQIVFEDTKILQLFSGRVSVGYLNPFIGGMISYKTSFGREGEVEIPSNSFQVVNLEAGERITRLVITKEGVTKVGTKVQDLFTFYLDFTRADIVKDFQVEGDRATIEASMKFSSDELEKAEIITAECNVKLTADVTFRIPQYYERSYRQIYQGNTFETEQSNIYMNIRTEAIGELPADLTLYVKLENTDKFVFLGGGSEENQFEVIDKPDGQYIKVTTKVIPRIRFSPSAIGIPYTFPKLKFMALPGAALGEFSLIGDIYVDLSKMLENNETGNFINLHYEGLIEDSLDLTGRNDSDSPFMWKVDTTKMSVKAEILQQNLATVTVTPGLEEVYSNGNQAFYPTTRKYLNAMAGIGSGSDGLNNYKINIPIPRKGESVSYSDNGLTYTSISEYDMFLRNEPRYIDNNIDYKAGYRLEGETTYISATEVGNRWNEVVEIYIVIETFPAKSAILVYLDLEAEDKENVGLGDKQAYIAAQYQYNNKAVLYGPKATYIYQDFQIRGKSWIDNNENGRYENGEPLSSNSEISLLQNNSVVPTNSFTYTISNGEYTITTYLFKNLALKFNGLDGDTEGIKPTLKKDNLNDSISVFEREGEWTVALPSYFDENQSGYDLGIVKLPILTANNTQVGYKSEAQANTTVINQTNAPVVNSQIIYSASADPSVAKVSETGMIKGLKENSLTTATVSVKNSLGDEVTAEYQIAVSDNKLPIVTVHPWVAIEGDRIPDLWAGITAEDPEEEYPAWKAFLFGSNNQTRSIPADKKIATIYTNAGYTDEISLDDALNAHGLYYVRYSVEDDKENVVTADTTLTVYGKMQGKTQLERHYFNTGVNVSVENNEFYYLDTTGARIPVMVTDTDGWTLTEGVLNAKNQVAAHPNAADVTEGVVAGTGRTFSTEVKAAVDSKVNATLVTDYIAVVGEADVRVGWLVDTDGVYKHYNPSGLGTPKVVLKSVEDENGIVLSDTNTGTGIVDVDTSTPGVYQYVKTAEVLENYDNVDDFGAPLKNTASRNIKITVVGKPEVKVSTVIYITPDQATDQVFIKDKIAAVATYHDGTTDNTIIPETQITYQFNEDGTGGKITSVDITAWGGREDNISDPVHVEVVVREIPALMLPDIHLRKGTSYGSENFTDRVITPEDEHNEYKYLSNDLDTRNLGKYKAQYQVSDKLTGADTPQSQIIYVHGIPEITATDHSLYSHQSTGEAALIDAVKSNAKATVEYTKADGTTEIKTIPANELQYEVSPDYVAGTAGRYKVTITANDEAYVPAGLEPMQVTKDVYVTVADQLFDVTFSTNSDNFHNRGTLDGEAGPIVRPTIFGNTAVIAVPIANEGYHFDGFKTLNQMKATESITLGDGTVIAAGSEIPVGTLLSLEQVQTVKIYSNVGFQAYFSATPVLNGHNIKLYVGESYGTADLGITANDLDGDAQGVIIDDGHVNTNKAGTYQVKASVTDGDQNYAEMYVYVQVYGKTELEGYDPIHIRKGQNLSEEQLTGTIKATYEAPPEVPETPWDDKFQAAVRTEVPFTVAGAVDTQTIGLTQLTISAEGQIAGQETSGQASAIRKVFVHGNPIITANDGSLFTHESTASSDLINLIKPSAQASVEYVNADGSIRIETIPSNKLNYEIKPEENYQAYKEGTYKVTISFNDGDYVPSGLQPVDTELLAAVIVSDKAYSVKFSINNDVSYHKGDYEGGVSEFNTNAIHGNPVGRVPVPVAADGYHFDGFKTITAFTTTDDIRLADGSIILAGATIPAGTILTPDQVKEIKIYKDVEFQAYFSASPTIAGENIILYEGEGYGQDKLHIEVTDIDQNAQLPVVDDVHVNANKAGTYQVKVTVSDTDGNLTEKYLYVQVVGKTKFIDIPDLHTRKGPALTAEQLLENIKATYDKPLDIPEEPWPDTGKVNNGQPAIATAVEVRTFDVIDTDTVQKTKVNVTASGMIHGREMIGQADSERDIYIHGLPVIVAYDNGIYTHQSTSDTVLEQIVQTGAGSLVRDPASAYVEYVQADGSIKKVAIDPSKITYEVNQFVPLTAGDYMVNAKVDDFSVLAQSQVPGLTLAVGEKAVKVVVADKMYTVMFEMGEHGGLEDPTEAITAVAHGKKVAAPKLAPEEGYTLDYWVDEAGNRVSNISDVVITENRKFTAEFKLKEFTVRFIGKKERVIKTEIVKYGHDATPPTEDKDVKNSKFNGWSPSYQNIKADTDIYATYDSGHGGGGGGHSTPGYVPSGPGSNTTINESGVPKNPFEDLVTIGTNTVPTGNMEIPTFTGLPKTGDLSTGVKANIGYQATLIDGTRALSEEEPLVGQQNGSLIHVFEGGADWRKCILHIILLIISALEAIFYLFKRKKDKRLLETLRKKLEEEDE